MEMNANTGFSQFVASGGRRRARVSPRVGGKSRSIKYSMGGKRKRSGRKSRKRSGRKSRSRKRSGRKSRSRKRSGRKSKMVKSKKSKKSKGFLGNLFGGKKRRSGLEGGRRRRRRRSRSRDNQNK
jgi:hypothetical protein